MKPLKYIKALARYYYSWIPWWFEMPIWTELNSGDNFKKAHDRWDNRMPKWKD